MVEEQKNGVFIALMRGINIGGTNKVTMNELREVFTNAGCKEVTSYIQTGNIVFTYPIVSISSLVDKVLVKIQEEFVFTTTPRIMILSLNEFKKAVDENPYKNKGAPNRHHCYFLSDEPDNPKLEILKTVQNTEEFELKEKIFFLYTPDGLGRSKLAKNVEKTLGVHATARNYRSVMKIWEIAEKLKNKE